MTEARTGDPPATGNGLRVLVVEDNAGDRWFFAEVIRGRGHTVVACESAEAALNALASAPADIVVLDVLLPGMDGVAFCRRLRELEGGDRPVILAATASEDPATLEAMLDAGADDFVRKPVDPELLSVRLAIAERTHDARRAQSAARRALDEKSRLLETLFRNVGDVFFSADLREDRLTQVSPRAEELLGVSPERLMSEPGLWRGYFKVDGAWEDAAPEARDRRVHAEYELALPDGQRRWIRLAAGVERDAAGAPVRVDGIAADGSAEVVARAEAERRNEELRALHRLSELSLSATSLDEAYRQILEHVRAVLGCPIALLERLDAERDHLVTVAAAGLEMPTDDPWSVPLHKSLSGVAVRTGEPVLERDPRKRREHQAPHLTKLPLKGYAAFPLAARGEVRGAITLATLEPRTYDERFQRMGRTLATAVAVYMERLEAEEALRESEARFRNLVGQLQQANQELESFAYSVSHDLRAPLRTMQGFAHALLQNFGTELPEEARDYVRRIVASGHQSEELISDLLAYSRMSFERVELKSVPLEDAVDAALEQVGAHVRDRDAEIHVERPLPSVRGNHTMLVQILANLVSNGVKFVPPDRTPVVRIRAEEEESSVRIVVEDNGVGVPEGQEERIFRVFERLSEHEAREGTGVGLAIVRRGVQRMGGSCGVDRLPQGSAFWVTLPRERRTTGWRPWARRR